MYQQYFGFIGKPFENTPDPERFFMGKQYRESLAVLMHSVLSRKVLTVITGDIGLGKTTLGRTLLDKMPENTKKVEIIHPRGEPGELLGYVASAMSVDPAGLTHFELVEALQDALREHAANEGRCVLVIDESQLLTDEHFEEIRLLTNLETSNLKLIQIILLGQLELLKKLQWSNMRPLRQRIAMIKQLQPMSPQSTGLYVKDRLEGVGGDPELFPAEALSEVYRFSQGIPRLINQICDFALIYTYSNERDKVSPEDVREAAADIGLRANPEKAYLPSGESHRQPQPMPARAAEPRKQPEAHETLLTAESKIATQAISPPPRTMPAASTERPAARLPEPSAQSAPPQEIAVKRSRGGIWALTIILLLALAAALLWLNHREMISLPGLKQPLFSDSATNQRVEEGSAKSAGEGLSPPAQSPDSAGSDTAVGKGSQSVRGPIKPQTEDSGDVHQNKNKVQTGEQKGEHAVTVKKRGAEVDQGGKPLNWTPREQSGKARLSASQTRAGVEPRIVDTWMSVESLVSGLQAGWFNQAPDEPPGTMLPSKVETAPGASYQEIKKKRMTMALSRLHP